MRGINPSPEMDEDEKKDQGKLEALRTAVEAGEESGIAEVMSLKRCAAISGN